MQIVTIWIFVAPADSWGSSGFPNRFSFKWYVAASTSKKNIYIYYINETKKIVISKTNRFISNKFKNADQILFYLFIYTTDIKMLILGFKLECRNVQCLRIPFHFSNTPLKFLVKI